MNEENKPPPDPNNNGQKPKKVVYFDPTPLMPLGMEPLVNGHYVPCNKTNWDIYHKPPIQPPPRKKSAKKRPKQTKLSMKDFKKKNVNEALTDEKNEYGHLLRHCRPEPMLNGQLAYQPPRYGKYFKEIWPDEEPVFCVHCHLKPCITYEMHEPVAELGDQLAIIDRLPMASVRMQIIALYRKKLMQIFGKKFLSTFWTPNQNPLCLQYDTYDSYPDYSDSEEGEGGSP